MLFPSRFGLPATAVALGRVAVAAHVGNGRGRRRRLGQWLGRRDRWRRRCRCHNLFLQNDAIVTIAAVVVVVAAAAVHVEQFHRRVRVRQDDLVDVVLGFHGEAIEEGNGRVLLFEAGEFGLFVVQRGGDRVLGRVERVGIGDDRSRVAHQVAGIANGIGKAEDVAEGGVVAEKARKGVPVDGGGILLAAENVVATAGAFSFVVA